MCVRVRARSRACVWVYVFVYVCPYVCISICPSWYYCNAYKAITFAKMAMFLRVLYNITS